MRIRHIIICGSAALAAIAVGGLYFLKPSVSARIGAAAKQSGSFDLAKLTDFNWDQAYIVSPYEPRERICARLASTWTSCLSRLPPAISEGDFLLVFARGASVVHHELHSRRNGDFCDASCFLQLTPEQARFTYSATQNRHVLATNSP